MEDYSKVMIQEIPRILKIFECFSFQPSLTDLTNFRGNIGENFQFS